MDRPIGEQDEQLTISIDAKLAGQLVSSQFPIWKDLPVRPVELSGWDNRTFHLGDTMLVRLPSAKEYAVQVEKEQVWLPKLAPFLSLKIPVPLAMGKAGCGYPWKWSIYSWIEGDSLASLSVALETYKLFALAGDLGKFLNELQKIESQGGPRPGLHSFYRGGDLKIYDEETRRALSLLEGKINTRSAAAIWEKALSTSWNKKPVWVHGDISAGNLLLNQDRRLSSVIDFGQLSVGDPSCDLAVAWTAFKGESREKFQETLSLDDGTWARGRAWALWKALIVASGLAKTNAAEGAKAFAIINEVCAGK